MTDNVNIDGEVDAGFSSYWSNDEQGQTVGGTTKDDKGDVKTDVWPDIGVSPDDVTDLQEQIIREVALNDDRTQTAIAEKCDANPSSVSETLSEYWPEKSPGKGIAMKDGETSRGKIPDEDIEEIRRRILNGETTAEISEEYDVTRHAVANRARGKYGDDSGSDIPPLEFVTGSNTYRVPEEYCYDGECENDNSGDETGQDETGQDDTAKRKSGATVKEIVMAMKRTAVHNETKNALEEVEKYL